MGSDVFPLFVHSVPSRGVVRVRRSCWRRRGAGSPGVSVMPGKAAPRRCSSPDGKPPLPWPRQRQNLNGARPSRHRVCRAWAATERRASMAGSRRPSGLRRLSGLAGCRAGAARRLRCQPPPLRLAPAGVSPSRQSTTASEIPSRISKDYAAEYVDFMNSGVYCCVYHEAGDTWAVAVKNPDTGVRLAA